MLAIVRCNYALRQLSFYKEGLSLEGVCGLMKNSLRIDREGGFTLVELMITMGIMVGAMTSVLMANASISQTSEGIFQRSVAIQDANQVIERMRNTAVTGTFPGNVTAAYPNSGSVSGFSSLTSEVVRVTYADRNGDGNALTDNPLDVTVTVTYLENGRRNTTMSLRSLVTQR